MSDLPKRVLIDEEGPREGFQSEKKMIPVADKVRLIEALADTGLGRIACVSYVNPKRVPTMADAEEVAAAIHRKPGIQYSACGSTSRASSARCAGRSMSTVACASPRRTPSRARTSASRCPTPWSSSACR